MKDIVVCSWVNNHSLHRQMATSFSGQGLGFITVGKEHESMAMAYAEMQKQTEGCIRVYAHQDVLCHDRNFADKVRKLFDENSNVGFAGVIGATRPQPDGGSWWEQDKKYLCGFTYQTDITRQRHSTTFSFGNYDKPAAQLDGLMLITDKDFEWPKLPGIHFLDLWMCNRAKNMGMDIVCFETNIEHRSWGETTSLDYKQNKAIYKKTWDKYLQKWNIQS